MSLVDEVAEVIAGDAVARGASDEFVRLSAFYDRMKRLGLVRKQEYDLPLIDTVGRTLYNRSGKVTPLP